MVQNCRGVWFVYVLVSGRGRTYVGITTDVGRRLRQHNGELAGGARATRAHRPWHVGRLLGPIASRGGAQVVEARVKRRRGALRLAPHPLELET
ncbi:MAG: GIY-YIG nuclease family protein [Myxococcales bacterium]|nr:GIY-YIG nuclease family protein [Myxococcales bacterium]